jgi:hypothetical protein
VHVTRTPLAVCRVVSSNTLSYAQACLVINCLFQASVALHTFVCLHCNRGCWTLEKLGATFTGADASLFVLDLRLCNQLVELVKSARCFSFVVLCVNVA